MRTLADLARHLKFTSLPGRRPRLAPLILVTDHHRLPEPEPVVRRLPAGSLVILRHYEATDRRALAGRLAQLCRARRLRLLVAGDLQLAVALGCGLHLPDYRSRGVNARIRLWHRRRGRLLTAAAHDRPALVRASALGADAALLSPVFPTMSHPGSPSLGLPAFRRLVRGARLAVFALGGVSARTAPALKGSGAIGVATVSGL